jgi:hypothetical protein
VYRRYSRTYKLIIIQVSDVFLLLTIWQLTDITLKFCIGTMFIISLQNNSCFANFGSMVMIYLQTKICIPVSVVHLRLSNRIVNVDFALFYMVQNITLVKMAYDIIWIQDFIKLGLLLQKLLDRYNYSTVPIIRPLVIWHSILSNVPCQNASF